MTLCCCLQVEKEGSVTAEELSALLNLSVVLSRERYVDSGTRQTDGQTYSQTHTTDMCTYIIMCIYAVNSMCNITS